MVYSLQGGIGSGCQGCSLLTGAEDSEPVVGFAVVAVLRWARFAAVAVSSSPCRAELPYGHDEQDRGINGGDPPRGERAVYAAKARAARLDCSTVGGLGGALIATHTRPTST